MVRGYSPLVEAVVRLEVEVEEQEAEEAEEQQQEVEGLGQLLYLHPILLLAVHLVLQLKEKLNGLYHLMKLMFLQIHFIVLIYLIT